MKEMLSLIEKVMNIKKEQVRPKVFRIVTEILNEDSVLKTKFNGLTKAFRFTKVILINS